MISKGRQQFKVRAEKNLLGNSGRDLSNSWEGSLSKKFWARLLPCTSPVFPTDSFSSKKKKIPHLHFLLDSSPPPPIYASKTWRNQGNSRKNGIPVFHHVSILNEPPKTGLNWRDHQIN